MQKLKEHVSDRLLFYLALVLVVYMPLHVFIVQSASLLTGGIEIWKAAKDVLVFLLLPALVWLAYRRGLFTNRLFRTLFILAALYGLLHGLFLVLDKNDDTGSALVASVYNTRLFVYMLLGWLVGTAKNGEKYLRVLLTAAVIIASIVALFGVLQYFLPHDLLTHVGYSLERGVKPIFFIDDKPDLPRVMSTLKDPNSFGAYLILPILLTGYAFVKKQVNKKLFTRPFRRGTLGVMLALQTAALFLTFSRGAVLGLALSIVTILSIATGQRTLRILKKYGVFLVGIFVIFGFLGFLAKDTYLVQNVIFHADESTVLEDPNELRVSLTQKATEEILEEPVGHGPGTAGLVAISNPKGGVLTENYYLQIAYEVGWGGLALLITILSIVTVRLFKLSKKGDLYARVLFASLVAYLFYSLLIHLWSNEAIALQWWLLTGIIISIAEEKKGS
ncbi:O-antigen ligase family protein [Candidatus Saccharibacteria bacterium]|nr:O-antigen ligase family protein [Candidatus Saccharibacteria bacterium]